MDIALRLSSLAKLPLAPVDRIGFEVYDVLFPPAWRENRLGREVARFRVERGDVPLDQKRIQEARPGV